MDESFSRKCEAEGATSAYCVSREELSMMLDALRSESVKAKQSDKTTHIGFQEFLKAYTFYRRLQLGAAPAADIVRKTHIVKALEEARIPASPEQIHKAFVSLNDLRGVSPTSRIAFVEWWRMISQHRKLHAHYRERNFTQFYNTWGSVYRPGAIRTPIHKRKQLSPLQDFVAGSMSGIVTTLVGHPFDVRIIVMMFLSSPQSALSDFAHNTDTHTHTSNLRHYYRL
jgi:hypothetical protein